MLPEDMKFIHNDIDKSRDELLELIVDLRKQILEYKNYMAANSDALTAMSADYTRLHKEVEELRKENKELSYALTLTAEKELLKTNELFGRTSEKLSDGFDSVSDIEIIDEAETEVVIPFPSKCTAIPTHNSDKYNNKLDYNSLPLSGKKPKKYKKGTDLSKLPSVDRFILKIEQLDELYGKGNWRIAHWKKHTKVEHSRVTLYAVNYYSPVISVGLEHRLITVPYKCLLQKSFVTESLMLEIIYQKFFMAATFYRLEKSFRNFGLNLSRQTMSNWFLRFTFDFFSLIAERLHELMLEIPYHQCDETTCTVIRDGRKAGSKSYIWVHITSELLDTHPIVEFCYELTRGTDHLRKFYEDFEGFITCDAYCSYHTLEKEKQDIITVCGCAMHLRRRFFQSLLLADKNNLSQKQLNELPESIALSIIGEIYNADEKLKTLSSKERKQLRDKNVRPLVDKFYNYISTLDTSDPLMSSRLKDAINYAINQKKYLCRFLDDGHIPIDDGATERHIRSFAIGRNNFMFCNTIEGAQALAIMYTVVETAKANHVNVYTYLRYILEEMPQYLEGKDRSFVDKFLPWSEEYAEYEKTQSSHISIDDNLLGYDYKPKTPRKYHQKDPIPITA